MPMPGANQTDNYQPEKNYYIPMGYEINPCPSTMDTISGAQYWTRRRLNSSRYFQYHVYQYAAGLIARAGARANVLDLGCGPATKLAQLALKYPTATYVGIDQASAVDYCKKQHDFGTWYVDDIEHPSFPVTDYADIVICSDVIEHVLDPDRVLAYIEKVSKPGAAIVISTPDRVAMAGDNVCAPLNKQHVREWSSDEFLQFLDSRGVTVVDSFLTPALKFHFGVIFLKEALKQFRRGQTMYYNHVCHLQMGKA